MNRLTLLVSAILALVHSTVATPVLSFQHSGGVPDRLVWDSVIGRCYELCWSHDLVTWTIVGDYPKAGTGVEMSHEIMPAQRRFFRITSAPMAPRSIVGKRHKYVYPGGWWEVDYLADGVGINRTSDGEVEEITYTYNSTDDVAEIVVSNGFWIDDTTMTFTSCTEGTFVFEFFEGDPDPIGEYAGTFVVTGDNTTLTLSGFAPTSLQGKRLTYHYPGGWFRESLGGNGMGMKDTSDGEINVPFSYTYSAGENTAEIQTSEGSDLEITSMAYSSETQGTFDYQFWEDGILVVTGSGSFVVTGTDIAMDFEIIN